MKELPCVSIVMIGYNEAENLENTFCAVNNFHYPKDKIELIYVDSGSEDRSIEIAEKYTSKVFVEKSFYPNAKKLYEKVRFKETGRLPQFYYRHGKYWDYVIMSVTKEEYSKIDRE